MSVNIYHNSLAPDSFQSTEFKAASYDDLLDENSAPFAPNSHHRTYNVGTMNAHRHGSSIPSSQKSQFTRKQSEDLSTIDTSHRTYPPQPIGKEDSISFWRKLLPESVPCRLYVITVLIETAINLAIEGELLLQIKRDESLQNRQDFEGRTMSVYLSIFALAHVFQLAMAVDAVYARNTLQFILLTVFNGLFLVYAIIQISEVKIALATIGTGDNSRVNVLTAIIPVVIAVAEVAYIALGWKIYNEFGWKVYKFLGADRQLKRMYANYQVYECLIKFDVFFWAGFSVQFIVLILSSTDWEYYVTIAALPLSLVLLVEGHLAARHESKMMMLTFMSGCVGALVYFAYKLIKVLLQINAMPFKLAWKSLSIFSIIAIGLLLVTFVYTIILYRNFGRGLKEALERKKRKQHGHYASQHQGRRVTNAHLNRMSIE